MIPVRDKLKSLAKLTEAEYDRFLSYFNERHVRRKEHVFVAGEVCKLAMYCEQGFFRKYMIGRGGEELVQDFAMEGHWIGDLASLNNRVPTPYHYQALEDCVVQVMPFTTWERLSAELPAFASGRYAQENRTHARAVELLALEKHASVEEKYMRLLERFPGIATRVAAVHIASYLGIRPESLSRLRSRLARGKR